MHDSIATADNAV